MEGIEVAQAAGAQVVADQQAACDAFFADIDQLCTHAAEYLAEMSQQVGRLAGRVGILRAVEFA